MLFTDNFQTLDDKRWLVHHDFSFPGNNAKYMNTHTYVDEGKLVLELNNKLKPATPKPKPGPTPEPDKCPTINYNARMYGDKCTSKDNKSNCLTCWNSCYQSWDARDPNQWNSEDAMCRCLGGQMNRDKYEYGELVPRGKNNMGDCKGCQDCRWSWPRDDPLKWKSDRLLARCMPGYLTPYDTM